MTTSRCELSTGGTSVNLPPAIVGSQTPSRHDGVTAACPVCATTFSCFGKKTYCSDACKAAASRRRRAAARPVVAVQLPKARPRRPVTVYECGSCGERSVGEQRCGPCGTFMRRVGIGGCCPECDAAISVSELVGEDLVPVSQAVEQETGQRLHARDRGDVQPLHLGIAPS